jgi:hypothetical protein
MYLPNRSICERRLEYRSPDAKCAGDLYKNAPGGDIKHSLIRWLNFEFKSGTRELLVSL